MTTRGEGRGGEGRGTRRVQRTGAEGSCAVEEGDGASRNGSARRRSDSGRERYARTRGRRRRPGKRGGGGDPIRGINGSRCSGGVGPIRSIPIVETHD